MPSWPNPTPSAFDADSCAHLLFQHDSAPLCILSHVMLQHQVLHQLLDLLMSRLQLLPLHTQLQLQLLHHTVLTAAGQGCCLTAAVRLCWLLAASGCGRLCALGVSCLGLLVLWWLLLLLLLLLLCEGQYVCVGVG
jgi:hypothetical protein